uniref:Uncharacterized protein n=1 Tax=Anabas testudineus TaxID=64144 RepID=A0A3Q1IGY5_ANATE
MFSCNTCKQRTRASGNKQHHIFLRKHISTEVEMFWAAFELRIHSHDKTVEVHVFFFSCYLLFFLYITGKHKGKKYEISVNLSMSA